MGRAQGGRSSYMVGNNQECLKLQFTCCWQNYEILHDTFPTDVKGSSCPVYNTGLVYYTAVVHYAALTYYIKDVPGTLKGKSMPSLGNGWSMVLRVVHANVIPPPLADLACCTQWYSTACTTAFPPTRQLLCRSVSPSV